MRYAWDKGTVPESHCKQSDTVTVPMSRVASVFAIEKRRTNGTDPRLCFLNFP